MVVQHHEQAITVDEYYAMWERGAFHPEARVELIEGRIVPMTPIGPLHGGTVNRLNRLLSDHARRLSFLVSIQNAVRLDELSEPQPDIALLRMREDDYSKSHARPRDILLVIEVAVTSERFDREVKGPLYGRHGIPELWLVVEDPRRLEVHRRPGEDGYAVREVLKPGDTVTPERLPDLELAVEDLLPVVGAGRA